MSSFAASEEEFATNCGVEEAAESVVNPKQDTRSSHSKVYRILTPNSNTSSRDPADGPSIFGPGDRPVSAALLPGLMNLGIDPDASSMPLSARELFAIGSEPNHAADVGATAASVAAPKRLDSKASLELGQTVAALMRRYDLLPNSNSVSSIPVRLEGRPSLGEEDVVLVDRSGTPKPPTVRDLIDLLKQNEHTIDDYLLLDAADLGLGNPQSQVKGPPTPPPPTPTQVQPKGKLSTVTVVSPAVTSRSEAFSIPPLPLDARLNVPSAGQSLASSFNSVILNGQGTASLPAQSTRSPLIPAAIASRYRGPSGVGDDWDASSAVDSVNGSGRRISLGSGAAAAALRRFQGRDIPRRRSMRTSSLKDQSYSSTTLRALLPVENRAESPSSRTSSASREQVHSNPNLSSSFHSSLSYYSSVTPTIYADESATGGGSVSPRNPMLSMGTSGSAVNLSTLNESLANDSASIFQTKNYALVFSSTELQPLTSSQVQLDGDNVYSAPLSVPTAKGEAGDHRSSMVSRKRSEFDAGTDMIMMSQARHEQEAKQRSKEEWRAQHNARAAQRRRNAAATREQEAVMFSEKEAGERELAARRVRYEQRKKDKQNRMQKGKVATEQRSATKKKRPATSKKKAKEIGDQENNYTEEQLELLGKVAVVDESPASGVTTPKAEETERFSFRQVPAWFGGINRIRERQRDEEWERVERLADEGIFSSKYLEVDDHAETVIDPEHMSNNFSTAEQREANKFLYYLDKVGIYTIFAIAVLQIIYLCDLIFRCSFDVPYDIAGYVCETLFLDIPAIAFNFYRGFYFPIEKKGVYIVDNALQRQKYVRSPWFVVDVIGSFPIEIIGFSIGSKCTHISKAHCSFLSPYWKLNRILILRSFAQDTSTVLEEISFKNGMHPSIARVTTTFLQMLGISHVAACIFNIMLEVDDSLKAGWLLDKFFDNRSTASKYLQALDWSTKSVVGFAKGNPFNIPLVPVVFTLIVAFFGIAVFASFIGAITAYLQRPSAWNTTLSAIDSILDEFSRQEMPADIVNEATQFYWHLYETARHSDSVIQALDGLPKPLQVRLLSQIGSDLLRKVPLLRPEVADQKFVMCLSVALVPQVMVPFTVLFHKGDKGDSMAFITHGKLGVVPPTFSDDRDLDSVFFVLKAGSYVGEIALILGVPRTATVSSLEKYANLLVLQKDDFSQITKDLPSAARRLRMEAESRLSSSLQKGSDALNFERARRLFDAVSDDRRRHCFGLWLMFTAARSEQRELQGEAEDVVYTVAKSIGEEALVWGGDDVDDDDDEGDPSVSEVSGYFSDGSKSQASGAIRSNRTPSTMGSRASNIPHTRRSSGETSSVVRIDVNDHSFSHFAVPNTSPQSETPLVSPMANNKEFSLLPNRFQNNDEGAASRPRRRESSTGANGKSPTAAQLKRVVDYIETKRHQRRAHRNKRKDAGGEEEASPREVGDPFYEVVLQAIQAAKSSRKGSLA